MADDGDSISTRQRSFVGLCEAMPTNRRFPPPWSMGSQPFDFASVSPKNRKAAGHESDGFALSPHNRAGVARTRGGRLT